MEIINSNTKGINQAVKKILGGEIVFIPTDTVYGIAASPYNDKAIKKIFSLKKRSYKNSLVLLCSNYKMAKKYAIFNKTAENLKKKILARSINFNFKKKIYCKNI